MVIFTDWFRTLIGVLQRCILSPLLFNSLLEMVMARASDEVEHIGVVISGFTITNLRFANDIATLAESSDDLQTLVSNIHREGGRMGRHINAAKTETQYFLKQN